MSVINQNQDSRSLLTTFTECSSLEEMRTLCDSLISQYGKNAQVIFDAGENPIYESIIFNRTETK